MSVYVFSVLCMFGVMRLFSIGLDKIYIFRIDIATETSDKSDNVKWSARRRTKRTKKGQSTQRVEHTHTHTHNVIIMENSITLENNTFPPVSPVA